VDTFPNERGNELVSQSADGANTAGAAASPPAGEAQGDQATTAGAGARPEELAAELSRVEAERDAAVAALDKREIKRQRGGWFRRGGVGVLVVIFSILLPVTFITAWAHYTVVNDSGWNGTVGPLASHPVVTAAAAANITDQIYAAVNPQEQLKSALPPRAQFLATPLANAAKGYVQTAVTRVLQSSQFQALWRQATSFSHRELIQVLEGKSQATTTTNGQVVLNLVPVLNQALQSIQGYVSGVVGHQVTLPTITSDEIPSAACERIATAIGRPVPANCAQIPLFPADKLNTVRRLYQIFNRSLVLLLILTPVVAAIAIWLSRRRRRTVLQLAVGGILGLVIVRRAVIWLQPSLVNAAKPRNRAAVQDIVNQILHVYFNVSRWLLIGLLIVVVVGLLTGPYAWAKAVRRQLHRAWILVRDMVSLITVGTRDETTLAWVDAHADWLRLGGIAVAVIILLAASVSFIGFLIIAALLAVYEFGIHRLVRLSREGGPSDGPPSETAPGAPGAPTAPAGPTPAG
jgi:hypothetical protein